MRKLILAVTFVTASIFTANAQADSDLVQIGLKGGVNLATVTSDEDSFDEPKSRTSFNLGFVAEVPYSNRFSLQGEVLYSGQGFEIEEINVEGENAEYQLGYIQIPVLAKLYLIEGLNIYAGPQIGFQVSEKIKIGDDEIDVEDNPFLEESEDIDFGAAVGAGYKFDNGFFLDARYNRGFSELFESSDARNSVISLGVGFMF
ncbi:porin family protein [Mesonia sp. K7]|uniref:porin family protein n=1 Tax=Mesonia sp. K7 TaxID=2218606 RepID=UPI000DA87660|nr:porin family protein [Mesonia sp. K7]PZD79697.1 PorT family protein [Mesonia sp. K7]